MKELPKETLDALISWLRSMPWWKQVAVALAPLPLPNDLCGWRRVEDYCDLYTMDEFLEHVKGGGITNDDGSAYAAVADQVSRIQVSPRGVLNGMLLGTGFTHIAWYNK